MQWCVTTSFSILVNGSSSGFFKYTSGLQQRDPLSYLFIVIMEALS